MIYKHLTIEEREKIQQMLWQKASIRTIAKALNRNPSSIFRERQRNRPLIHNVYTPRVAHQRALFHRTRRGREERLKNDNLRAFVISHLKLGWSPEQIAATSKKAVGASISHEAIYQFVYARVSKASGLVYAHQEDLRPYLARRRKRRMRKGLRSSYRIDKGPLPSINERLHLVEYLLNTRPRKRLGWKTPYEVFYELTGVALQS